MIDRGCKFNGKEAKSKGDLQRLLCVDEIGEFQVCENPYSTVTCEMLLSSIFYNIYI